MNVSGGEPPLDRRPSGWRNMAFMASQTSTGDSGWTLIKFVGMAAFVEKDLWFSFKKKKSQLGWRGWWGGLIILSGCRQRRRALTPPVSGDSHENIWWQWGKKKLTAMTQCSPKCKVQPDQNSWVDVENYGDKFALISPFSWNYNKKKQFELSFSFTRVLNQVQV